MKKIKNIFIYIIFLPFICLGNNILYNGIVFNKIIEKDVLKEVKTGMNPYYLKQIPKVIKINTGRELFIDDFLIKSTNLERVFHYPEIYKNPILTPDKEWEQIDKNGSGFAAPFSDGVWYDEKDNKFKMWYMGGGGDYNTNGNFGVTCYAESIDGINWVKPNLDIVKGTNIIDYNSFRDSNTIWLDKQELDPSKRYKMFLVSKIEGKWYYIYKTSSDGIHFKEVSKSQRISDRSTVFKNPFRNVWGFSIRHNVRNKKTRELIRARDYMENEDILKGVENATADLKYFWLGPWEDEIRHPIFSSTVPGIYNVDVTPYESIMLGLFTVWQGPENKAADALKIHKVNQIMLGYSRDGYEYFREDMNPFISYSKDVKSWNSGNIQSVIGSPIIVDDKLYFYFSARKFTENDKKVTSAGLAILRRDGFASMSGSGYLITNNLNFEGNYLFLNANIKKEIKVEILDEKGEVITGFSKDDCLPLIGDSTKHKVMWKNNTNLSKLKNKNISFKFYLNDSELYSFWVSNYTTGESNGYTAGGGKGLNIKGIDIK